CEFLNDDTAESLGLTGKETFSISGVADNFVPGKILDVVGRVTAPGKEKEIRFQVKARVDTPLEIEYLKNGGVLNYVLRNMMQGR
ncbi:MAG: hypothetical protein AB7E95_14010, partial [Kiritimatiellales bacterium]